MKIDSNYQYIFKFNRLWQEKKITTPLLVMIGGYAGVGKSTVALAIARNVDYISFYPTGFARVAAQNFISKKTNPALYLNTFYLHRLTSNPNRSTIVNLFKTQRDPVVEILAKSASFIACEHQNTIIDGNHVCPKLGNKLNTNNPGLIVCEFYLKVTDPEIHLKMIQGPTHNRSLSKIDFKTSRILHDFIVSEAIRYQKPVFEYTDGIEKGLELVDQTLKVALKLF